MPNGKRGDHPLTDILLHKLPTFSPVIDDLIREIAALGGKEKLEVAFDLFAPPPLATFEEKLRAMRDQLKQEARERGWEV